MLCLRGVRVNVALAIALASACSSSQAPSPDLVVIAHPDDDMLFMQPDMYDVVHAGQPVVVLYITAGDGGQPLDYVEKRYTGAKFAYGSVAGSNKWSCEWIHLRGHAAQRCKLADRPVTLIFLGYPDGGVAGDSPGSLLQLWQGKVTDVTTIAEQTTTYSADELIDTVAAVIKDFHPSTIRSLELSGTHGDDHSDHMIVGALAQLALARAGTETQLIAYRGYNIANEPVNLTDDEYARSSLFMRAYSACMIDCGGTCGKTPCEKVTDGWYDEFLHRRYSVAMQDASSGKLSSIAGCFGIKAPGDASVVSCTGAADLQLDDDGFVRVGDGCLEVDDDHTLDVGPCEPDPRRYFRLDEEGHLWSGIDTPPGASLFDRASCVYVADGKVSAGLCGADRDYRWTLHD